MASRKFSSLSFLDTSSLIPLLDTNRQYHDRLVQHLTHEKSFVCIDTVVLSEFLVGLGDNPDRENIVEKCTKQFRVHSFDARTAVVCAEIFKVLKSKGQIPRSSTDRQITKVDIMIMASSIVCGADEFIFEDNHFSSYSKLLPDVICGFKIPSFIRLCNLPCIEVQDDLPVNAP